MRKIEKNAYIEYANIYEKWGKYGFLKIKPDCLESFNKVLFEFVGINEDKTSNGKGAKVWLTIPEALTLSWLLKSGQIHKMVADEQYGLNLFAGGGSCKEWGFEARCLQFWEGDVEDKKTGEKKHQFLLNGIRTPSHKDDRGDGKVLYPLSFKEKYDKISLGLSKLDEIEIAVSIENAISMFNTRGLEAFLVKEGEEVTVSEPSTPTSTPETFKVSAPTPTVEEIGIVMPNFDDYEDGDEEVAIEDLDGFIATQKADEVKRLTAVANFNKFGEDLLISCKYSDGKPAKDLLVRKKDLKQGSALFAFYNTLKANKEVTALFRVRDIGDFLEFVSFEE